MIFLYTYLALGLIVPVLLYITNAIIIYRSYMREPKKIAPFAWIELSSPEIKQDNFSKNLEMVPLVLLMLSLLWWLFLGVQLNAYYNAYRKSDDSSSSSFLERFARYRYHKLHPEQYI